MLAWCYAETGGTAAEPLSGGRAAAKALVPFRIDYTAAEDPLLLERDPSAAVLHELRKSNGLAAAQHASSDHGCFHGCNLSCPLPP
jgi:hypothetical protein